MEDSSGGSEGALTDAAKLLVGGDFPVYIVSAPELLPLLSEVAGGVRGIRLVGSGSAFPADPGSVSPPPEGVVVALRTADLSTDEARGAFAQWGDPHILVIGERASLAVEAFRHNASGFLVQPVPKEELREAFILLRERGIERRAGRISASLLALLERQPDRIARFPLRSGGKISFLRADEIDWMEADRDYVRFHVGPKKHLIRAKISEMEKKLPVRLFARIHRSVIVNIDRIRELHPLSYGEYAVVLNDGQRLTLSRSHRSRVLALLTQVHSF